MNIKDLLTTIFGVVLVIAAAVNNYLESLCAEFSIEILPLIIAIVVAIIAWFTGKNGDGTKKERITKH